MYIMVISRCPCHIVLKRDVPVLPLISVSPINKDTDSKSLLEFDHISNSRPASPKANCLTQRHQGWCGMMKSLLNVRHLYLFPNWLVGFNFDFDNQFSGHFRYGNRIVRNFSTRKITKLKLLGVHHDRKKLKLPTMQH